MMSNIGGTLRSMAAFIRYNAINVFAGRFVYFLVFAVALFLTVVVIHTFEEEAAPSAEAIYYFLLTPGVLLVFYPSAYSIQSDVDSRMIETLFGIPDYRYKVWLARNVTQYLVIAALLLVLAVFCRIAMANFPIGSMLFHLMFPIIFLGSLGFIVATITKSGNGTAAVMVVLILFFWIAAEPLEGSKWDLFHNPFAQVEQYEVLLWAETTLYNRIYILIGSAVAMMFGLLRLQQREKFI
jgi:hypothetical protein